MLSAILKGSLNDLAKQARTGDVWSAFCWLRRTHTTQVEAAVHGLYPDGLIPRRAFDAVCDAMDLLDRELSDDQVRAHIDEHCV